jgi:hypothetical protein
MNVNKPYVSIKSNADCHVKVDEVVKRVKVHEGVKSGVQPG